jgi:hypothetical protein
LCASHHQASLIQKGVSLLLDKKGLHFLSSKTVIAATKRLQCRGDLRKFDQMKTFMPTIGFRHLRRPWIENPGWVAL